MYLFVGIYACDKLPFYDPRDIPDPFFFGVYGDYGCNLGYALATGFFDLVWAGLTLLGLIFSWFKKCLKKNLLISLLFVLIWGGLSSYSYFQERDRINNLEKEQTKKIEQEKRLESTEKTKEANTPGNYIVKSCYDIVDTQFAEDPVIRVNCFIDIKMPGNYLVRGVLQPADSTDDGFDNVLMESATSTWGLGDESVIMIHFNYRHLAKSKVMPDGMYTYKIYFYPDGELKDKLFSYIYTGTTTNNYNGSMFIDLAFKSFDD